MTRRKARCPCPLANANITASNARKSTQALPHDLQRLMEVLKNLSKHITRTAVVSEGLSYRSELALSALQCTLSIAKHDFKPSIVLIQKL